MSAFAQGFSMGGDLASQAQKIQLAEELAAREKERFGWEREQQQLEKQGRQAAIETYGKVGTQDYSQAIQQQGGAGSQQAQMLSDQAAGMGVENEKASAQSVVDTMRQNAGQAPAKELTGQTYTAEQANQDYVKRMYALNPEKAQQSELAGMQLKNVKREAKLAEDFDKENLSFRDTLTKIYSIAETGGMKGLAEAATEEGLKTKFVLGKNGLGSIQVLGPKGDVIKTFTDVKSATEALVGAAKTKFTQNLETMFGSADKAAAFYQKQQELKNKERETDIHQEFYGKGGTYERVGMARANNVGARSGGVNSADNQEKLITKQAEILVNGQPNRFKNIEQAKAWIVNAKLKGADTEQQWNKMELELVKQGGLSSADIMKQKDAFYVRQGFAPQSVIDIASSGINPVTKKPFTEAEQNDFARRYPNSYVEFGTPSTSNVSQLQSAIPPTEKNRTEVKTNFGPKQATEAQTNAFNKKQEDIKIKADKVKEEKQAIRVYKEKEAQTKIVKAQEVQKQRENESNKQQLSILEAKREKALRKDPNADVRITDRSIENLKKRLQD
jgi:hypothetical protein